MNTTAKLGFGVAAAMLLAGMVVALLFDAEHAGAQDADVYDACRSSEDLIETNGLPGTVDEDRCPVSGREIVSEDGATVAFPAEGQGVAMSALTPDGSERELEVINLPGDTFRVEEGSEDPSKSRAGSDARAGSNGCSSGAYSLGNYRVGGTLGFTVNTRSIPSYLNKKAAITDIRSGGAHITRVHNPCGVGDGVGAAIDYRGGTSTQTNATYTGCAGGDGRSVVGFGPLRHAVAVTCTSFNSGSGFNRVTSSDIRFNTNQRFVTNVGPSCRSAFAIEGIATHERGHTFGIDHVGAVGQTMYPSAARCSNSFASLGRGDALGLNRKY